METDQAEQIVALLNQPINVLKMQEAEETDALMTSKRHNRNPFPLDNQDIQTTIVMVEKKDTFYFRRI